MANTAVKSRAGEIPFRFQCTSIRPDTSLTRLSEESPALMCVPSIIVIRSSVTARNKSVGYIDLRLHCMSLELMQDDKVRNAIALFANNIL